jgi:aryl-alcohol dehydrogenase-like predicted oxidoreductase
MKMKPLGPLKVSSLCFGGNIFGWTADEAASFRLLDAFTEAGGNFIDTADVYSRWVPGHQGGESETIIGNWLTERKNRERVVIATKVGIELGPDKKGLSKNYILRAVEDSLKRLQTDYVDLYISHRPDDATPIEQTMEAYALLLKQGKIRAVGASNYTGPGLREALETSRRLGLPQYQSLQPLYNLSDRADFEQNLLPVCQEYGLAVTPYYALASGFLTGKYRSPGDFSKSARGGGVEKYLTERGLRILGALDQVAKEHRTKPAAVAIAWLMSRPTVTAPIASATSVGQLNDLVAATRLELAPASLEVLDRASQTVSK